MKKLFVWEGVLMDHYGGIAFALAENVEDARALIFAKFEKEEGYLSDIVKDDLKKDPLTFTKKVGFYIWGSG